jgi:hypothetical protein
MTYDTFKVHCRDLEVLTTNALAMHGVKWRAQDDAPATFADAVESYRATGEIIVYSGASDSTIYSTPQANHAARAWHDFHHVTGGHDFTMEGERAAMHAQLSDIFAMARRGWLNAAEYTGAMRLLWLEIIGQAEHFAEFGEFPADQVRWTRENLGKVSTLDVIGNFLLE